MLSLAALGRGEGSLVSDGRGHVLLAGASGSHSAIGQFFISDGLGLLRCGRVVRRLGLLVHVRLGLGRDPVDVEVGVAGVGRSRSRRRGKGVDVFRTREGERGKSGGVGSERRRRGMRR